MWTEKINSVVLNFKKHSFIPFLKDPLKILRLKTKSHKSLD